MTIKYKEPEKEEPAVMKAQIGVFVLIHKSVS